MKKRIGIVGGVALLAIGGAVFSIPPARAAMQAVMSCAQTSACLEWDNTKSGDAIKGVSSKGNALHGQTKFNSTGKTAGKAGVLGEDLSSSGTLDAGVLGASTNGAGVLGTSTSFNAVEGLSTNSTGVYGQTDAASGLGAAGRNVATTHDNNGAGLLADGGAANDGLHAFAGGPNSVGVYAFSELGSSLVLNQGPSDSDPELYVQSTGAQNDLIQAADSSGADIFRVSDLGDGEPVFVGGGFTAEADNTVPGVFRGSSTSEAMLLIGGSSAFLSVFDANGDPEMTVSPGGDLTISGLLTTGGSCHSGCLVGNSPTKRVTEYTPLEAEPTIEDNGEATLFNGRADVPLDPRFANVIDISSPYTVTITPEGDSHSLYVANRNAGGFTVRESQGGRSTLVFDYRIVAKRYGVRAQRLPMLVAARVKPPNRQTHH